MQRTFRGGSNISLVQWPSYYYRPRYAYRTYPAWYLARLRAQRLAEARAAEAARAEEIRRAYISWQSAMQNRADAMVIDMLKRKLDMLVYGVETEDGVVYDDDVVYEDEVVVDPVRANTLAYYRGY